MVEDANFEIEIAAASAVHPLALPLIVPLSLADAGAESANVGVSQDAPARCARVQVHLAALLPRAHEG